MPLTGESANGKCHLKAKVLINLFLFNNIPILLYCTVKILGFYSFIFADSYAFLSLQKAYGT